MSYMRGDYYIYGDDEHFNFYTPEMSGCIPIKKMDEFVVMRFYQMTKREYQSAIKRARQYEGNFGFDGLAKHLGRPTVMERIKRKLTNKL